MKNLAGNKLCDNDIREELFLANIPIESTLVKNTGEVPYSYIGRLGDWIFKREWYYWTVSSCEGFELDKATELYNILHPLTNTKMGKEIRADGFANGEHPKELAQPIHDMEYFAKLVDLGFEKKTSEYVPYPYYVDITNKQLDELIESGKIDVERYIDRYHIDSQIGLNIFAEFIKTIEIK